MCMCVVLPCLLQVLDGVTPQVQFVKVVSDELVELMGSTGSKELEAGSPQIILMAGLQVGGCGVCVFWGGEGKLQGQQEHWQWQQWEVAAAAADGRAPFNVGR